ncbi:MAG: DUF1611 domain-containing protein [Betaproteobacteria bacterium]
MTLHAITKPHPGRPTLLMAGQALQERLARAKKAYTTRRLDLTRAARIGGGNAPRAGDFVLARVLAIGHHPGLELASGRRAQLHMGDEVLVCYGSRYAPDQFEAILPEDLGACDLVAAGGLASRMRSRHTRMKAPTALEPIGLLCDDRGAVLNLESCGLAPRPALRTQPPVLAVLGTSMNSGKTTTCASLVRGFVQRGLRVAAAKVTGTGAGGDRWCVADAGASPVLDFTDAGVPSTFGLPAPQVESIFATIVATLADTAPDVIVLEVADGLFQCETAALLESRGFGEVVDGIVFASGEAMGAKAGVEMLQARGHCVLAVSGLLTASPLATREAAGAVSVPVVANGDIAAGLWLPDLEAMRAAPMARRALA